MGVEAQVVLAIVAIETLGLQKFFADPAHPFLVEGRMLILAESLE